MARIDPVVRHAALAALRRLSSQGPVRWSAIRELSDLYGIPAKTIYRWYRAMGQGNTPEVDLRSNRKTDQVLPQEILTLVAHYATESAAHKEAVKAGLYKGSYRQFVRDLDRLPPALRAGLRHGRDDMIRMLPMMSYPLVGRNETWVVDHTMSDLRVLPPRGTRAIRV